MTLVIAGIVDKGNLEFERVGFRVTSKVNLSHFVVFATTFEKEGFYNRSRNAFWFTPEEVNVGDLVVLSTKSGIDLVQNNPDETKTYFKHWGLQEPLFLNEKSGIVIAEVTNWSLSDRL